MVRCPCQMLIIRNGKVSPSGVSIRIMSHGGIRPKKGCVAVAILGIHTHDGRGVIWLSTHVGCQL